MTKRTTVKLMFAAAVASVLPLIVTVMGPLEIFLNNKQEFLFRVGDFLPVTFLLGLILFAVLFALLAVLRKKAFLVALAVIAWLSLMTFLQATFLNFGLDTLAADGLEGETSVWWSVLNLVIWLAVGAGAVFAALKVKDEKLVASVAAVALATALGVSLLNLGMAVLLGGGDEEGQSAAVLSNEGIFEVGADENVIVIVLDRFDVYYYDQLVKDDPAFFSPLDGFTYYNNNISLYSRTYPSITYMLTGMEQDFDMTASAYFEKAYGESTFLKDLKRDGYSINLYTESYYAYRDAEVLSGIADNAVSEYRFVVHDRMGLSAKMLALCAYRYAPTLLKKEIQVSTSDFSRFFEASAYEMYQTDDAATYETFQKEGVTVGTDKRFTFLHLNGCHDPFTIGENGERVENGEALPAIRGVFGMVFSYLDALKASGLYEDATIIITGDHARAISDRKDVAAPRVTALFVKQSGESGEPLAYSSAPVCQENLRATIVKSAGIPTEEDYGAAVFEIAEDADVVRKYCFEKTLEDGTHQIVEYRVTGDANEFSNWTLVERRDIGKLYK